MVITLDKLQSEHAETLRKHGIKISAEHFLVNMIDHAGTLSRAVMLYQHAEHDSLFSKAVAELCIAAAGYATVTGFHVAEAYKVLENLNDMHHFRDDADASAFMFSIVSCIGQLAKYHSARKTCMDENEKIYLKQQFMGALLVQLARLVDQRGLDINKIVPEFWKTIKK